MQAGFVLLGGRRVDRIAHGIAELGQHHLFGLVDGENGAADDEQAGKGGEGDETAGGFRFVVHGMGKGIGVETRGSPPPGSPNCSRGRICWASSSMMTFFPIWGSTLWIVSR